MQIYIRAGETILPTGGNVRDYEEALDDPSSAVYANEALIDPPARTRSVSGYQKRYKKAFARLKPSYVKKDGTWKKDGFKRCVKASHAAARK